MFNGQKNDDRRYLIYDHYLEISTFWYRLDSR